jgi:hypothetical protein
MSALWLSAVLAIRAAVNLWMLFVESVWYGQRFERALRQSIKLLLATILSIRPIMLEYWDGTTRDICNSHRLGDCHPSIIHIGRYAGRDATWPTDVRLGRIYLHH